MQVQSILNVEIENKYKRESEIIKTGLKYFTSLCNRVYHHKDMEGALYRGGLAVDKGEISTDKLTELKTEVERNLALYRFAELHDLFKEHCGSFRNDYRGDRDSMITFYNRNPNCGKDRTFNLYTGRVYMNNLATSNSKLGYYESLTEEDYTRIKYGEKYFNETQFIKMCLFPEYKTLRDENLGTQDNPTSMMDVWNFDMFIEIDDIFMVFMNTFLKNGGTEHDLSNLICNTLVDRLIYLLTNIGPKLDLILQPNIRYVGLEILNARKNKNLEIDIFDRGEITADSLKSEWSLLSFMKDMIVCHLLNKNINSISTDLSITEANKVISNLNAVFMTTMDYNIDVVASYIPGFICAMSDNARGLIPKCLAELAGALASTHRRRIVSGRSIVRSIKESLFDFSAEIKRYYAEDEISIAKVCRSGRVNTDDDVNKDMLGYSLIRFATKDVENVSIGSNMVGDYEMDNNEYVQAEAGAESPANMMSVKERYYLDAWTSDLTMLTSEGIECFDLTSKASILKKLNALRENINRSLTKEKHSDFFIETSESLLQSVMTATADLAGRNISRERNARLYGSINLGEAWR